MTTVTRLHSALQLVSPARKGKGERAERDVDIVSFMQQFGVGLMTRDLSRSESEVTRISRTFLKMGSTLQARDFAPA